MRIALVVDEWMEQGEEQARILCTSAGTWPEEWEREIWCFSKEDTGEDYRSCPVNHIILLPGERDKLNWLCRLFDERRPDAVIFFGDAEGEELGTRLGIRTDCFSITGVSDIRWTKACIFVKKSVYGYNLTGTFEINEKNPIVVISPSAFVPDGRTGSADLEIRTAEGPEKTESTLVKKEKLTEESGIEAAEFLLVCGRGAEDREAYGWIQKLAKKWNGCVGGTRPFVLDGWAESEKMVGISGALTKPKVCMVFGASGAAPFIMGIEKSDRIIGINQNPQALLFQYCDVGIVGDCREIAEELVRIMG